MGKQTFYDQWHRIAELRIGLRPSVTVRQHRYRGEVHYVYHEVIHSGFFRARPETHALVQSIKPNQTLHEIWRKFIDISPKTAPGQKDFFDLIVSLYKSNLLYVEGGVSEDRLLDRAIQKKKKPFASRVSELLFFRIPLLDPEPTLKRFVPFIRHIYSIPSIIFVSMLCLWAAYEFILGADRAFEESSNILQLGNLLPLYIAMVLSHIAHEFSHAALCKYYGGNVRTMGVMLLMFTPLPYADVSSSWAFRNKWHRAAVGAAGMYSDILFCSIATILWAYSPPGMLNEVAMNLMFVTAAYTVLFNANPLMRFDGYYILSDLVEIPNLHAAARKQAHSLFKTLVLGGAETHSDRVSGRRKAFLVCFFCMSNIYRVLIIFSIVKFVADQYFGLGLAVAAALTYSTFFAPIAKFLKPLGDPRFVAKHRKKVFSAGTISLVLICLLAFLPLPYARKLDGVVEAKERTRVFVPVNGIVTELHLKSGEWVDHGQIILDMTNPELVIELKGIEAKIRGVMARLKQSVTFGGATLAAIEQEYDTMKTTREYLVGELSKLVVHAPHSGFWTSPNIMGYKEQWLSRGTEVGLISYPDRFQFRAVLKQEDASEIALMNASDASVKIEGLRNHTLEVTSLDIIPFSQKDLPSVAVSPLAGGDVATDMQSRDKPQAVERFFLIIGSISTDAVHDNVLDGRSGWMRIKLPPRSLGWSAYNQTRQFFQKRYKL